MEAQSCVHAVDVSRVSDHPPVESLLCKNVFTPEWVHQQRLPANRLRSAAAEMSQLKHRDNKTMSTGAVMDHQSVNVLVYI